MAVELAPTNKVFRMDELLARYTMFSTEAGKPLSKRTLEKWRKVKKYPKPIVSRPRILFLKEDVIEWEKSQGWDSFLEDHDNGKQETH